MATILRGLGALVLATALAALAGCSGSTSDGAPSTTAAPRSTTTTAPSGEVGDEASYTASLAEGLAAGGGEGEPQLTADQAACVAPVWVATIGVDALQAGDVGADALADPTFSFPDLDLADDQAGAMVDAFTGCGVDISGQFRQVLTDGLSAEQAACVDGEITDDEIRAFLAQALQAAGPGDALDAKITAVSQACDLPG